MADAITLKTLGEWDKEIGVPLKDALRVSIAITGRTGEEACKHALILMAESARAMTPKSKKNRKVHNDSIGKFVGVYRQQKGNRVTRLYEFAFSEDNPDRIEGTWEQAKLIGNRGLAKRSWMWGLNRLGVAKREGKEISAASRVYSVTRETVSGYIKENRLNYITKIMPAGWEREVTRKATNKIMAQAQRKIERQWQSAMRRRTRSQVRSINQFFLKAAA